MVKRNTQIKSFRCFVAAAVLLVALAGSPCAADLMGGTLSWPDGMVASGDWASTGTILTWIVLPPGTEAGQSGGNYYNFSYTFTSASEPALSHFILQVSDSFGLIEGYDEEGFVNDTLDVDLTAYLGEYVGTGTGQPNPGMPGNIYGLKFEGDYFGPDTTRTWSSNSWREPVWGNFYAKGSDTYAYNSGFLNDPYYYNETEGKYNYELYGYIATPDTTFVPVPAAVLLGILGLGAVGIKLRKYA